MRAARPTRRAHHLTAVPDDDGGPTPPATWADHLPVDPNVDDVIPTPPPPGPPPEAPERRWWSPRRWASRQWAYARWAPKGAPIALTAFTAWLFAAEDKRRARAATKATNQKTMMDDARRVARSRRRITVAVLVISLIALRSPTVLTATILGVLWAVPKLGKLGLDAAGETLPGLNLANGADRPKLTGHLVLDCLAIVHPKIDQSDPAKAAIMLAPGLVKVQSDYPGQECVVDLPAGVANSEITDQATRERFASAIRIDPDCIHMEPVKRSHPGRLRFYFSDEPLGMTGPAPWVLAKTGTTSLFHSFPIGVDRQGNPVEVSLRTAGGKMAGLPRMGKSFLLRLLAAAVALDRNGARLSWYGLKGGGDGVPIKRVAYRYAASADTDAILPQVMAELEELVADMTARYDLMDRLKEAGETTVTEVTEELASRYPELVHHVVIIDEIQEMCEHSVHGKKATALLATVAKRGPAVGLVLITATQVSDHEAVPTKVRNALPLGWCFKVDHHSVVDMALGTGSYKLGCDAVGFELDDKGLCWFKGNNGTPRLLKVALLSDRAVAPDGEVYDELDAVIDRAYQLRKAAGHLTGFAAGHRYQPDQIDEAHLVEDLVDVWVPGEERMPNQALVELLQAAKPRKYAGWKAGTITRTLKGQWGDYRPAQCPAVKDDGSRTSLNGVSFSWLHEAWCEVTDADAPVSLGVVEEAGA